MKMEDSDFGFAFNDMDLSDRILRIEIIKKDSLASTKKKCSNVKIKTVHISSPILAAKSPFFFRLFKNDMRISQKWRECLSPQRHVILRINASEEVALTDLLNFMYTNNLSSATSDNLLDVLRIADKFQVTSCMNYCIEMLLKLPMSLESALSYLELQSSVSNGKIVQPLKDAAKQYLAAYYKDFAKSQEEVMKLPLSALEAVLGNDSLQVTSEDAVFDFILKWARTHYPKLEERREILTKLLTQLIRFPYMSWSKLNEAEVCAEFDREQVSKMVLDAFCSKIELPYGKHNHASKDGFPGRNYIWRFIKVVRLQLPWPNSVIYFDLKKDECAKLYPSGQLYSQGFALGGRGFYLVAACSNQHQTSIHHFSLDLWMTKGSELCQLGFEFFVTNNSSKVFQSKFKVSNHTLTDKRDTGQRICLESRGLT